MIGSSCLFRASPGSRQSVHIWVESVSHFRLMDGEKGVRDVNELCQCRPGALWQSQCLHLRQLWLSTLTQQRDGWRGQRVKTASVLIVPEMQGKSNLRRGEGLKGNTALYLQDGCKLSWGIPIRPESGRWYLLFVHNHFVFPFWVLIQGLLANWKALYSRATCTVQMSAL